MDNLEGFVSKVTNELVKQEFAVIDNVLSQKEYSELKERFLELKQEDEFRKAGVGKQLNYTIDSEIRGDYIRWIDNTDQQAPSYFLLKLIEALIPHLNHLCFLGIKDYETHYAYYPKGKGYEKHRDRFKNNPHRIISFVYYLNEQWKQGNGGELVLYNEDLSIKQVIEPIANRLALFTSETIHEVLNCNTERQSITGWMLNKPKGLTFL